AGLPDVHGGDGGAEERCGGHVEQSIRPFDLFSTDFRGEILRAITLCLTNVREVDGTMIEQVRRFNRRVTQRVGALDDHFLARDRSLGVPRVLWEIGLGADGCDVRRLRAALDLDSGYLSRLLRSLKADGLVTVEPS